MVDGASVAENTDETTGFTKRVVIDWRTSQRSDTLKPAITITRKGAVAKVERGGEARYLLSVDAVIAVEPGDKVSAGDVLARIPLESAKTKDITGGLPRVAELFEARRPKDHAIIAEINGTIRFGSNRSYMTERTALHEIAHTIGVGTSANWNSLSSGGTWHGAQATALVKQFDGSGATLSTGGGHFWPYGLNYENEFSNTAADRHIQIVAAMVRDGL